MTHFYAHRQGNGCEIQFRGLLYAREVLISRTVAHKLVFLLVFFKIVVVVRLEFGDICHFNFSHCPSTTRGLDGFC
jgi:hypothetical protein